MTTEEKLKEIILSRYGTVKYFAEACELPYGTVDTILRRGIHKASITNVIAICKTLKISTDELAHDRIVPVENAVDSSDLNDVCETVSFMRKNMTDYKHLTIDGEPLSMNELELLLDGIDITVGIIKRNRSRKIAMEGSK